MADNDAGSGQGRGCGSPAVSVPQSTACGWGAKCCGRDPRGCIQPGEERPIPTDKTEAALLDGSLTLALCSIEADALRHAVDALAALQRAHVAAQNGFAADCFENAASDVRKAMRMIGA